MIEADLLNPGTLSVLPSDPVNIIIILCLSSLTSLKSIDRFIHELNKYAICSTLELEMCLLGSVYAKMATVCKILTVKPTCVQCQTVRRTAAVFIGKHVPHVKSCTRFSSCNLGHR